MQQSAYLCLPCLTLFAKVISNSGNYSQAQNDLNLLTRLDTGEGTKKVTKLRPIKATNQIKAINYGAS